MDTASERCPSRPQAITCCHAVRATAKSRQDTLNRLRGLNKKNGWMAKE